MIYTEYDPLQSVIVGDTYAPGGCGPPVAQGQHLTVQQDTGRNKTGS